MKNIAHLTNYKKEVGKRMRIVRAHFNESQETFAKRLNFLNPEKAKQNRITKIEKGEFASFMLEEINGLIESGISIDWIGSGEGSMFASSVSSRSKDLQDALIAQGKLVKCQAYNMELLQTIIELKDEVIELKSRE